MNNGSHLQKRQIYTKYRYHFAPRLLVVALLLVLDNRIGLLLKLSFSLLSVVCVPSIWRAYSLTRSVINAKSIKTYITQKEQKRAITKYFHNNVTPTRRYSTHRCPESEG